VVERDGECGALGEEAVLPLQVGRGGGRRGSGICVGAFFVGRGLVVGWALGVDRRAVDVGGSVRGRRGILALRGRLVVVEERAGGEQQREEQAGCERATPAGRVGGHLRSVESNRRQ